MYSQYPDVQQCDIFFAGAGLAGLALAVEMAHRPFFQSKSILLVDRDSKQRNDRTWCFWATDDETVPPIIHHSWEKCRFAAPGFEALLDIAPYRYHMVRGYDFYRWAEAELERMPNIRRVMANIIDIDALQGIVHTEVGTFQGNVVLNSAFVPPHIMPSEVSDLWRSPLSERATHKALGRQTISLLQHFKGWMVETPTPAFDPKAMTFMDFCIEQKGQTRFVYVLPFSAHCALVEFTVFSPALLPPTAYDDALQHYLTMRLGLRDYRVVEEEFGVIPMTDYPFPHNAEGRMIHIGTAGGFVKASSGYAFKRTLRRVRAFAQKWEYYGCPDPKAFSSNPLFKWLDSILLRVLHNHNDLGGVIFTRLFQQLPPAVVLRFLDEDSSLWESLRIVNAPPRAPFLRALMQFLWK